MASWGYENGEIYFYGYANSTSANVDIIVRSKGAIPEPTPQQITNPTLSFSATPVATANSSTVGVNGTNFTGNITSWDPTLVSNAFAYDTEYNAEIQLSANSGYELPSTLTGNDFNVTGATVVSYDALNKKLTVKFQKTGAEPAGEELYITYSLPFVPTGKVQVLLSSFVDLNENALKLLDATDLWDDDLYPTEDDFPFECIVKYVGKEEEKIPWYNYTATPETNSTPNTMASWGYEEGEIYFYGYANSTSTNVDIIIRSKGIS